MPSNKIINNDIQQMQDNIDVKDKVRGEINAQITQSATNFGSKDEAKFQHLAERVKGNAFQEIIDSDAEISKSKAISRTAQVIEFCFYIIYGIIGLEILLEVAGARDSNGFKQFLDTISYPLLAPFRGLMPSPSVGPFQLMLSYMVAVIIYILLHLAVNGFFKLLVYKKPLV